MYEEKGEIENVIENNRGESYAAQWDVWLACGEVTDIVYWELSLDFWKTCKNSLCPRWTGDVLIASVITGGFQVTQTYGSVEI